MPVSPPVRPSLFARWLLRSTLLDLEAASGPLYDLALQAQERSSGDLSVQVAELEAVLSDIVRSFARALRISTIVGAIIGVAVFVVITVLDGPSASMWMWGLVAPLAGALAGLFWFIRWRMVWWPSAARILGGDGAVPEQQSLLGEPPVLEVIAAMQGMQRALSALAPAEQASAVASLSRDGYPLTAYACRILWSLLPWSLRHPAG